MKNQNSNFHIHFIGTGRVASATGAMLGVVNPKLEMSFNDVDENKVAEVMDLSTFANAHFYNFVPDNADLYIVTAGVPRKDSKHSKVELFEKNVCIVVDAVRTVMMNKKLLIVTNPPTMLSQRLKFLGYDAEPFGLEVDNMRAKLFGGEVKGTHEELEGNEGIVNSVKNLNERILELKGFTQWTVAYALMKRIMKELEGVKR